MGNYGYYDVCAFSILRFSEFSLDLEDLFILFHFKLILFDVFWLLKSILFDDWSVKYHLVVDFFQLISRIVKLKSIGLGN